MQIENKHLKQAAKTLLTTFKAPEEFLLFINELSYSASVCHIDKRGSEPNDKGAFFVKLLMEEILAPWMKAGKNDIAIVTNGLYKIYDCIGPDGYHSDISKLIASFYIHNSNAPNYKRVHLEMSKYYNCLFNIYYSLDESGMGYGLDVDK